MTTMPETITELLGDYRRGRLRPSEVVAEHLHRIDEHNERLNAFVSIDAEGATAASQHSDDRWRRGEARSLEGVPVTVKDIVAVAGFPTGEGSTTSSGVAATADAPPVARLREAGAIILGKTTTSEFGWKGITDSAAQGTTRNPWHLDHSPGGSSGGAGASLAAGIGLAAHGNDGGGSIRIPASYCGLIGLKPTFGRVPQAPVGSPYSSLVANGALTRSVTDAALLLNVLSRPDPRDWHAVPYDGRDWRVGLGDGLGGLRIAYTDSLGGASADPEVADVCRRGVERLRAGGIAVVELDAIIEPLRPSFEAYWKAGFASRLRTIPPDRWEELDPGFRVLATEGLKVGVEEIDRAHAARAELVLTMRHLHQEHDILLTPTMPTAAPRVDTVYHSEHFDRWEHAVPYTVPFNLTGQPGASIPIGLTAAGLPVGLQLVADHFREDLVLRAARAILEYVDWPAASMVVANKSTMPLSPAHSG